MNSESPFLITQPSAELEHVTEFHINSQLVGIRLIEVRAKAGDLSETVQGKLRLDLNHKVKQTRVIRDTAVFDVALEMKATVENGASHALFELECCLEVVYLLKPGFTPDDRHFAAFGRGNLLLHCWPYLREFVHNATWRMGLALPPLPLLRVIPQGSGTQPRASRPRAPRKKVVSSK